MYNRKSAAASSASSGSILPLYQVNTNSTTNAIPSIRNKQQQNHHHHPQRHHNNHKNLLRSLSKNQLHNICKSFIITLTLLIFFRYVIRDLTILFPSSSIVDTDHDLIEHHGLNEQQHHKHYHSSSSNEQHHRHDRRIEQEKLDLEQDYEWNNTDGLLRYNDTMTFTDEQYPSLQYPLEHASLIGLYFAASWCPMSTPVTELLDKTFRDVILKPPPAPTSNHDDQKHENHTDLAIVYISSDRTVDEMEHYVKPKWFVLPFLEEERQNLKKLYKTCAKIEMEHLQIYERKKEIPTLIILSSTTRHVLTYDGIQDIYDHGIDAISLWYQLDRLNIALIDKY